MNFVFPCQKDRVIATPLHILGYSLGLRLILAKFVLEVAGNHPNLTIFCVKGHELTIWGDADMLEWPIRENPVFGLRSINDVDRLPNRK